MIQWSQLVPLRVRDGDGGHCRDDLLFFVRLLRCVCVDAGKLPGGRAGEDEKRKKKKEDFLFKKGNLMETCHQVCFTNVFTKHNVSCAIF